MKQRNLFRGLLMMLISVTLCAGFASCSDDDGEEDVIKKVTITNKSTYTLQRFTVAFFNSRGENLTQKEYGTLDPDQTVKADIPTGAQMYWMATFLNGKWYYSADYDISYRNMKLTTPEVGNWKSNN